MNKRFSLSICVFVFCRPMNSLVTNARVSFSRWLKKVHFDSTVES